jgi:hypothetical protein
MDTIGMGLGIPLLAVLQCEDILDPQLDQGNEEVIRVTLLTFGLKR